MPDLTVYTDSLGYQPADTTFTVTNIRFTGGAGGNGLLDGDSIGVQTISGDPITLVADATDPDRSCTASRADPSTSQCQHHHSIKASFHSDGANPERSGQPWRLRQDGSRRHLQLCNCQER